MYFGDLDARCDRGHHHPDRSHPDCPLRPYDADEIKMSIETAAKEIPAAVHYYPRLFFFDLSGLLAGVAIPLIIRT